MADEIPVVSGKKVVKDKRGKHPNARKHHFQPGESGNPAGKPVGTLSIKARVRAALEKDPKAMESFVKHFTHKNRELAWQMLEGKPKQETEVNVDKEGLEALTDFFRVMAKPPEKTK